MKKCNHILLCMIVLLVLPVQLYAQVRQAEFEIHSRGNLWETMKDNGTIGAPNPLNPFEFYPSMDWPGGPAILPVKDEQRSYMVAAGIWMGGRKSDNSVFFTENGPFTFVDQGTFDPITKITNYIEDPDYDLGQPEEQIKAAWTTSENIRIERTSNAWSFRGLNNFIIIEYLITNQQTSAVNDFYIGFPYLIRPSYQDVVVHAGWGDDFNRADEIVRYDATRRLLYAYDDTPSFSLPNDVGNYWDEANELRTPGYAGFSILHADPAVDGRPQPATVFWAQILSNETKLTSTSATRQSLYDILSGVDASLQAAPDDRLSPIMLMACGPYLIQPAQSIRIVVVEAVNGLPLERALQGLEAQHLLPAGRDSLAATIDRARVLFENNYVLNSVPPPSPELEIIPLPTTREISITWAPIEETWRNPITGENDFQEYRIYRGDRSFIGPYTQLRRIRPNVAADRNRFFDTARGRWRLFDGSISLGVKYHYAVTAVNSRGHESWLTNRNEIPVQATGEPAANTLDVRVFPNPFREVSGFPTRGEENSIVWMNLPAECTIYIYTIGGELVRTIDHNDPNSGEAVWNQLSNARQRVAPGMYVWAVTSGVGTAKGTLLIIK
jgi:hypothetical protein